MKIGMVRNAADENRKEVQVFLYPFPHTRLEKAKPLQGWYKSKHEPKGTRPRPCFTEAVLTEPYGGFCQVGCRFSLPAGEPVDTPDGYNPIESFCVGDLVYGRAVGGRVVTKVTGTSRHTKPEGLIVVVLSDGRRLRMTGDHPVYSQSRGWVIAESLTYGEELEDVSHTVMRRLRDGNQNQEVVPSLLVGVQSSQAETGPSLSGLRGRFTQSSQGSLRQLFYQGKGSKRQESSGSIFSTEGQTEISGDESADVGSRLCSSGEYVRQSEGAEVGCVPSSQSGGREERYLGLQDFQAWTVYGQVGTDVQHAFGMGEASGGLSGRDRRGLGLRTIFDSAAERIRVPARLLAVEAQGNSGGKRLEGRGRGYEAGRSTGGGLSCRDVGQEGAGEARYPYVVRVERIPGGVWVYDIETETGNFYQQGILVHNCYVNSGFRGYRGSGLITVPEDYGSQIRVQLSRMKRAAAGYFSSFTDPFLSLENYYHNTQRAAEEFVKVGLPIFFLSRLAYPEWAIDLLTKNPHSYAQKSINTSSAEDWKYLSPGALPLEEHFEEIAELHRRGIYVSIQVNPIIPGVTSHDDIRALFRRLAEVGADHVIVKFVEAGYSWAPTMVERMVKRFGDRGREFARLFTENMGGQRTVHEEYRMKAHRIYSEAAARLGLTYATCYEYRYRRDDSGNILDKVGVSIGREFTTADQCHGHKTPVYYRKGSDEQFRPLEECPPSGCLYCADENEESLGKPRCGDDLAGQANALEFKEFKYPMGRGTPRTEVQKLIQLGVRKDASP
jgi:DNA repair photolyase